MQARMRNPALIVPEALQALLALGKSIEATGLSPKMQSLVNMRASQLNTCSVCVEAGFTKKPEERHDHLYAVSAWRDMPYFTEAERAALALTEAVTRLSERGDGVTDEIWTEAAKHFDQQTLAALVLQVSLENVWNRLNNAVRQPANAPWS